MENTENNIQSLIDIIDNHLESGKEENFEHFLCLLTYITNNYHRNNSFIQKITQILKYYQEKIKSSFSNYEIFDIFKGNKIILLYL